MELTQLRAFLLIAEELHFGRAAERLNVGQPSLSRTIKQLESVLGSRLFDRNTRSVALTPSGRALVEPAREVLEAARRAELLVRAAEDGDVGRVRIAFAGASTFRLVGELARSVRAKRPNIQLELSSQNYALPALRRLTGRDVDLALGRWDVLPPGVASRVVLSDSLRLAVPSTHRLATKASVSFADLAQQPFVSLEAHEGSVLIDRLRRLAHHHGFIADVVQFAPDTHTALALVSAEVGCLLTLESVGVASLDPTIAFLPITTPDLRLPDVHLRAIWRADDMDPALLAVLGEFPVSPPHEQG